MTFKALLAAKTGDAISTSVVDMHEQDLMPGDTTVAVEYSTVNYKDAMDITGRADVIRQFPMIPGIDLTPRKLAHVTQVVGLADVPAVVDRIRRGTIRGRTVVDVNA